MSTDNILLLSLWIHVPMVTIWIGLVMFDLYAILAPGLDTAQRARLLTWSCPFVMVAIPVIAATGIWQTIHNPLGDVTSWAALGALKEKTYGYALFWKHGFVLATFAMTVYVRFFLAKRLAVTTASVAASSTTGISSGDAGALPRSILWVSLANAAACLGALMFATRMIWTLH